MKKVQKISYLSLFFITILLGVPNAVLAQTQDWDSLGTTIGGAGYCVVDGVATIQGIICALANVFSIALTAIGLAGFIMMIVGSLTWLFSGGNSQNVEKARKTMTFAVIGLVVALSSYIIIRIIASFTGIDVIQNFMLPASDTGIERGMDEWRGL